MRAGTIFTRLRQGLLIYVLLMVALGAWLSRSQSTDWKETLWVAVYPINGDDSDVSGRYIDNLTPTSFQDIAAFMSRETVRYGIALEQPVRIELFDELTASPPDPPVNGNIFSVMWWSLRLRYWAWGIERSQNRPRADIQLFVRYHDPSLHPVLHHSAGLEKGLIGVVNVFARDDMAGSNHVVMSHELLHTLGATDKYNPARNQPVYPSGFADPERVPLYPQNLAELMGGRIPVTETSAEMPEHLDQVVVGPDTAREIGWYSEQ